MLSVYRRAKYSIVTSISRREPLGIWQKPRVSLNGRIRWAQVIADGTVSSLGYDAAKGIHTYVRPILRSVLHLTFEHK